MQLNKNNWKSTPLRIAPLNENNFNNFQKNNIKMNKIKKSVEKIQHIRNSEKSNENFLNFSTKGKKEFKMTQYPIIKTSNTDHFISFKEKNRLIIYEQDFSAADFETAKDFRKYLNNKNLQTQRSKLEHSNKSPQSEKKKGSQNRKLFFKRGLFNKNSENDLPNEETPKTENSFRNKELLTEIEIKHGKIVEKLKKKNFYEPIVKLPYVCIKSQRGEEGKLGLNYKTLEMNTNSDKKVKRSQSKIFQNKYSQLKYNINEDGEALFKRIYEKNFKINDKTFGSLNLV